MPVEATNKRYLSAIEAFEADDGPVFARERRGTCDECGQETVQAVEQRNGSALRVDGTCSNCGWEFSRAGLVSEPEAEEEA